MKGVPLISGKSRLVKYYDLVRWFFQLSGDQNPGWLGDVGDYTTHLYDYEDYFINHYKDPY